MKDLERIAVNRGSQGDALPFRDSSLPEKTEQDQARRDGEGKEAVKRSSVSVEQVAMREANSPCSVQVTSFADDFLHHVSLWLGAASDSTRLMQRDPLRSWMMDQDYSCLRRIFDG